MMILAPDPFTLYCDASRTKDNRHHVVAGAVATVENWKKFDRDLRAVLAEFGIAYFRMAEFAHSVGQFANGWKKNESKRQAFLQRLILIMAKGYISQWLGACISQKAYDTADAIYQLHETLRPYPFCGWACVELAHDWQKKSNLDYLPMEYVFEEGDDYAEQLRQQIKKDYGKEPIFRKKRDPGAKIDELLTPLQVGDFVAYEIGKAYGVFDPTVEALFESIRKPLLFLGQVGAHRWGHYDETAIRTICNIKEFPKR
jgi:hypothetical protein